MKLSKLLLLALLGVAGLCDARPRIQPYDRHLFGDWSDDNKDGCNRRCELLGARSLIPVTYTTPKAAIVASGLWMDSYALEVLVSDATSLEIDHVVPLALAWAWGASEWTGEQRNAFYNDPDELNITTVHTNRAKSDKPPSKWVPPTSADRCYYFWKFQKVVDKYKLAVPTSEKIALGGCQ